MMFPLVRELALEGIPVTLSCRVLGFSRQGDCPWRVDPVSDRDWSDAHVINEIRAICKKDSAFGYRLITDELRDAHAVMGGNRVHRLCRENLLYSSINRPKRGSGKTPGPAVHDDLLKRDFTAKRVNEKWLLDITEHATSIGKLYLCAIMDCSSRRIVGYSIDSRMKSSLAVDALRHAVDLREPVKTIVHSDRGSQFRSKDFTSELTKYGLRVSIGRVGAAGDNAAMESFFALLQKNVLNKKRWETRDELRLEIVHWIEGTYHRRRRKAALGKLTPIEFETIQELAAAAA
jgi:transposase InsO family protein